MSFFPTLQVSELLPWPFRLCNISNIKGGPAFGGTHLPDLTIVTPVFDSKGKEIIFWAASRGHHADVSATNMRGPLWYLGLSNAVYPGRGHPSRLHAAQLKVPVGRGCCVRLFSPCP